MIEIDTLISQIKSEKYENKAQILSMILMEIKRKRIKINAPNKTKFSNFALDEMQAVIENASKASGYKEKSKIFRYADMVFGLVMSIYKGPMEIPAELMSALRTVSSMIENEMYLERAVDRIFEQDIISKVDVESLIESLSKTTDEYEKGLFYAGLIHYQNKLTGLIESSRKIIADYITTELERYVREYSADNEDLINALEAACDACKHFANEKIIESLYKALHLGNSKICYYAAASLMHLKKDVPEETVSSLAGDLIYADLTYSMLKRYGKESLFPSEYSNEEYLAKSDLVHWLTYPTELGKAPDEIELVGKVERKDEVYHVFKFRSDSDNLDEESKNVWLLGWSGNEGGTFSQFEKYDKFEKKTIEKTLKYIKKKVL